MTDKEKILAEIESELSLCATDNLFDKGRWTELNHLKLFIGCLPKEPTSEDLNEAATTFADVHVYATRKVCFKAGAEWKAKQGMTFRYKITGRNTIEHIDMDALAEKGIHWNDDIIVQIRKKE